MWTVGLAVSRFTVVAQPSPISLGCSPSELATAINDGITIASACFDALGVSVGASLNAEVIGGSLAEMAFSMGTRWTQAGFASGKEPVFVPASDLQPLVQAAVENGLVAAALSDLSLAIGRPNDTAFFAFRAIESIRQAFLPEDCLGAPSSTSREAVAESWTLLRGALGFERDELQPLASLATPRRHGAPVALPEEERLRAIRLAREVVLRFVSDRGGVTRVSPRPTETDRDDALGNRM